jgi:mono/diheme cytochrome c family protein
VVAGGVADAYRMPSSRTKLTDQQTAEMLIYVRSSWGNKASPVTAEEVKALRDHTDPASPDPIILQMR